MDFCGVEWISVEWSGVDCRSVVDGCLVVRPSFAWSFVGEKSRVPCDGVRGRSMAWRALSPRQVVGGSRYVR